MSILETDDYQRGRLPLRYKSAVGKFKFATWNIRGGIKSKFDIEELYCDTKKYNCDLVCLQETYSYDHQYIGESGTVLCLSKDKSEESNKYGMGFYISKRLLNNYWGVKVISNRIAIISFMLNNSSCRKVKMNVINIYAPTSEYNIKNPAEIDKFYDELQKIIDIYKRESDILMIMGDFNSKVGERKDSSEKFMGAFGKGTRNINGNRLCEFINENKFFIGNTNFYHPMRHRSTWCGNIKGTNYYNQIDYITVESKYRNLLVNARTYHGHAFNSDHGIVIATVDLRGIYRKNPIVRKISKKFNTEILANDEEIRGKYQSMLEIKINEEMRINITIQEEYEILTKCIKETASMIIGKVPNGETENLLREDVLLKELSENQKKLRVKLMNINDAILWRNLKTKRNRILSQIFKIVKRKQKEKLNRLAKELEENRNNRKCFVIQRKLKVGKYSPFKLEHEDGHETNNPINLLTMVNDFYKGFYNQEGINGISLDNNEDEPKFEDMITKDQVKIAMALLNNNKAAGIDEIPGELFKYGGDVLADRLANLYNRMIIENKKLNDIGDGILIPLNKSGKKSIASNTRPITLLNSIRKILSMVVLNRMYDDVEKYLPSGQCGFRRKRSTTEVVFTYRWLRAIAERFNQEIKIIGIDMSKAFDCINREKLMGIIKEITSSSNYRIVKYLLSNTTLVARISNVYGEKFGTSIGTPQGDALSPVLFTLYLEGAMREARQQMDTKILIPNRDFFMDIYYADDTDIISNCDADENQILEVLKNTLARWNLKINVDKTEIVKITPTDGKEIKTRKLGSLIGDDMDVNKRIQSSNAAFGMMWKIWRNPKIARSTKLKLYKAIILPVLMYNIAANSATSTIMNKLDTTFRRHIRHICCVYYPNTMSNKNVYKIAGIEPMCITAVRRRWQLLGHILRLPESIPTMITMKYYFEPHATKPISKSRKSNIGTILSKELSHLEIDHYRGIQTWGDMEKLKTKAQDRKVWTTLTDRIIKRTREEWDENEEIKSGKRKKAKDERSAKVTNEISPYVAPITSADLTVPTIPTRSRKPVKSTRSVKPTTHVMITRRRAEEQLQVGRIDINDRRTY